MLIIFIKNPEIGKVKTRLAATIGAQKALDIYKKLLKYTAQITGELSLEKHVWYSSYIDKNDPFFKSDYLKFLQAEGGLGEKMSEAFEMVFDQGAEKVVIIGSDCAELEPHHITEAYDQLDKVDVVLGPAKDGGYYLLGMNHFYPELFKEMTWSNSEVLHETLKRAQGSNLKSYLLPELNDVDTFEDFQLIEPRLRKDG